jgi:hypothetical protein
MRVNRDDIRISRAPVGAHSGYICASAALRNAIYNRDHHTNLYVRGWERRAPRWVVWPRVDGWEGPPWRKN